MSEKAEGKGWIAHATEAMQYFKDHAGREMTPGEMATYEALAAGARNAGARHDAAVADKDGEQPPSE
jgi:hypothetical protein